MKKNRLIEKSSIAYMDVNDFYRLISEDGISGLTTPELLSLLRGTVGREDPDCYKMIKEELDKRPHIKNSIESKKERQAKAWAQKHR